MSLAVALTAAAGALAVAATSAAPGLLGDAAASENGRIAYVSAWAPDVPGEVYRVAVATGRRTSLTRSSTDEEWAIVSPDGRTILFRSFRGARGNGLWAMNADGSGQRFLADAWSPSWSPDGARIAFVRDGVRTMTAAGTDERHVARGHAPAWSPAGDALAWIDGQALRVGAPDGSSSRVVLSTTSFVSGPRWSPDGTHIAIGAEMLLPSGSIFHGIVVVPFAGGAPRPLATVPSGGTLHLIEPRWSPDGARIAFVRDRHIAVARVGDGSIATLTRPASGVVDTQPAWSPDGALVAFVRDSRQVFVAPSSGGRARAVGREDLHARLGDAHALAWMPDGGSLVYSRGLEDNDSDIFTVQPGDVGRRRITTNDGHDWGPAFSPDGRWIAFVRTLKVRGDRVNNEIYVMRADGTGVRRLTRRVGDDRAPAWSPDGSRIVFARRPWLYTIRPDGTRLTKLRAPRARYGSLSWSPDGRAILAAWDQCGGGGELTVLRLRDGRWTVRKDLFRGYSDSPQWSPDGRRIVFAEPCSDDDQYRSTSVWTMRLDQAPRLFAPGGTGATWSPDGRYLAVTGQWPASTLAIVSGTGRRVRELTTAFEAYPGLSWQPLCTLWGTDRRDVLRAGPTAARVCGNRGRDTIRGGPARDRLFGDDGNDTIDARGGGFDVVGCGSGRDRVRADRGDLVGVDCERVTRR